MSNINLKIIGNANLSSATSQFSQLEAQVSALNAQLARMVNLQNGVDPRGYANMVNAGQQMSETFRNAAASSGMFEVQQLRVNSATDDYVKKLNKQKISFREMAKSQKVAQAAYHEQLRMMDASSRVMARAGSSVGGRQVLDIAIPSEVNQSLDTAANRLAFLGKELSSASTQMINWGKNTQWAGRQLAMGFTMPLAAAGAAAGVLFYQVDKELTRVTKVYNTTADQTSTALEDVKAVEQELIQVRKESIETAKQAAHEYGVAMNETLAVQADLAAVGMQGNDLQNSTTEVVKNAMLGEIEYQDATKATIALQSILNLSSSELTETWEYMNAIENATSLQMKDFAQAIPIALAPLKDMGATVQDLGVLLTGMVSRGIEVGKAANAIKSLGQRLYRPSKQIQEEFRMLTGEDIMGVIDSNKGNIMGMLEDIYSITKDLDQTSKQKVFSGLFGSYQRTTMGAMINSLGDITNGVGQATTAMEIGQQAAGDWSAVAQKELKDMQESASGQFKRAFEGLKSEMVEVGEPFLNIATMVIKAVGKIMSVINDMPGPVKVAIASLLGIAAVAGPVLMLTGLFANLAGNGVKVVAQLISTATKMEILDKETWAAKLATDALNTSFMSQTTATQKLNAELQVLIASLQAAGKIPPTTGVGPAPMVGPNGQPLAATVTANQGQAAGVTAAANATAQGAENQKKWTHMTTLNAAAAAGTVGSIVAMTASSNENVQHWASILMTMSIVAPLMGNMASGASKVAKFLTEGAANSGGILNAIAGSSVKMGLLGAGVGVAVVGAGLLVKHFYDAGKAAEKSRREMSKATLEMKNQSDLLDRQLGIRQKAEDEVAAALDRPKYGTELPELLQIADLAEKMNDDEHFKGQAKLIKNSKDEAVKSAAAMHVWKNVMDATNGSAEKAQMAVAALFVASGESAVAAQQQAKDLRAELENIGNISFNRQLQELDLLTATLASGRGQGGKRGTLSLDFDTSGPINALQTMMDSTEKRFLWSDDPTANKYVYDGAAKQGKAAAQSFWTAYSTATPLEAGRMAEDFKNNVSSMWQSAFEAAQKDKKNAESIDKLGITTAYQYKRVMEQAVKMSRSKDREKTAGQVKETLQAMGLATDLSTEEIMDAIGFGGAGFNLSEGLVSGKGAQGIAAVDVEKAMTAELSKRLGYTDKTLTLTQLLNSANAKSLHITKDTAQSVYEQMVAQQKATQIEVTREKLKIAGISKSSDKYKEMMHAAEQVSDATLLDIKNEVRRQMGLEPTTDLYAEITDESAAAAEETKKITRDLNSLPSDVRVNVQFTGQEVTQMYRESMEGVQQQMADDMTEAMETRHANEESSLQASQDRQTSILEESQEKQQNALERSQERAQNRMENRQEREEKALEDRWERRKDAAEKMWDARIKAVEKEIEAEQKAEEQRQKMFEAEIARIQRLNEMANTNIDFNVALNEGNFDEAAKIRNDAEASTVASLYEQAMDQMAAQSGARVDRLEGRQEVLEKQKDAYMDRLDKQADHQKYILQQRHERESNALRRSQEIQNAALKKRQAADSAALKKRQQAEATTLKNIQNREATSLRQRLDLFMSFIARDEKELRKHMKNVGISYNNFQRDVIVPKSTTWGNYFGNALKSRMRIAGNQLRSDKVWNALGEDASQAILKSMGFSSMQQFTHFVKTGEMKDFKKEKTQVVPKGWNGPRVPGVKYVTRHTGGFVDSGKGSRAGITKKGLHKSEQMVLAQKGEFVVNKHSAAANQDLLSAINQGKNVMGGAGLNVPGLVSGVMSAMLIAGLTRGMAKGTQQVANNFLPTGMAGSFGSIAAGNFAGMGFDGEQLKNAQTIANVGKGMGMSSRDIAIGIMTAITESMLRNVRYGDRDSQGLFQQRPSQGWGTIAQVTNPQYASRKFFEGLKGIGDRGRMTPWQAAQAVQRSAFSDGSNYRKYWEEASAIYKALAQAGASGVSGFVSGPGGRFKPINRGITSGLHGSETGYPAVDVAAPTGTPLYAVSDGVISRSYDITGYEPRRASYGKSQDGYRSYGRVVYLKTDGGPEVLYAHLSKRSVRSGQRVKGGSIIGRSGDTGNSTGSHLHFGSRGASPYAWFSGRSGGGSMGGYSLPQLAKGGEIKWDNTVANLHKNETVLTADLSQKLKDGINDLGSGGGNVYTINVNGVQNDSAEVIANKVMARIKREEARLGGKNK